MSLLHKPRFASLVVGLALGALYVAWLLATSDDLGYARDEGFYFSAAGSYRRWFELLWHDPASALDPLVRDRHWRANSEHPAFIKTLFVFSHWLFFDGLGWFSASGTAYRFVGMLFGGATLALLFYWGTEVKNRWVGLGAALSYALMPRVFFHAHLACFDVPVAFMWFVVMYAYYKALGSRGLGWSLVAAVLFGLLLNTKHNSWLLPPIVLVHFVLMAFSLRGLRERPPQFRVPRVLIAMMTLGPLVFWLTWPWLWSHPFERFGAYAAFHLNHDYYNMEFLGRTYYEPPMPRSYAWVMTAATVPASLLVLAGVGIARALREAIARRWLEALNPWARRGHLPPWFSGLPVVKQLLPSKLERRPRRFSRRYSAYSLWGLGLLAGYAPWWSSDTPIFGGTKHWIVAYPFLALFVGLGFDWLRCRWREFRFPPWIARTLPPGAALLTLAPALAMTWSSHPFGLSAYTALVGGAPGAASLGLNRTFWGYTTGSLEKDINRRVAGGGTLYLHDTARSSFDAMQRDGRLRDDISATLDIAASDYALYHHEQHMARVEYQIWVDYGTLQPAAIATHHGVPVVWLYERPRASSK